MQNLLQKSRRLNRSLQGAAGQPLDFGEVAGVLQEVTNADVLIVSRKGKVLGLASSGAGFSSADLAQDVNSSLLDLDSTKVNVSGEDFNTSFNQENLTLVPINGGGQRLGTLLVARAEKFDDDDLVIAESVATVIGMEILRSRVSVAEEESRNRAIVQMALDTLSYSEQEAVEHIFKELNGREGLLVASKIADRVGITRSVIVNALRKFESAGVIESRSLGMKGTFIKILNDQLLPELDKLINR